MGLPRPFLRSIGGVTVAIRTDVDEAESASLRARMSGADLLALDDRPTARRAGFLTGRDLIREVVDAAAGVPGDHLDDGPCGSPRIDAVCRDCGGPHGPVRVEGYRVSVSHSGGVTAVAVVSDEDARVTGIEGIGLDLESATAGLEKADAIRALLAVPDLSDEQTLRRWTEVEAVVKADGRGLRVSPDAVRVADAEGGRIARIANRPGVVFEVLTVDVGPGFAAALAVARRES